MISAGISLDGLTHEFCSQEWSVCVLMAEASGDLWARKREGLEMYEHL